MKIIISKFLVILCAVALVACGTFDPERQVSTFWNLKSGSYDASERNVEKGDVVLRQPILPTGMTRTKAEFRRAGENGAILAEGSLLFEVRRAQTKKIYCSLEPERQKSGLEKYFVAKEMHFCFEDSDGDSLFDLYYRVSPTFEGLPAVNQTLPPPTQVSIPYENIAPEELGDRFFLTIIYSGPAIFGQNTAHFRLRFGTEEEDDYLPGRYIVKFDKIPHSVSFTAGAVIKVLEKTEKGLRIQVVSPFREGRFSVYIITTVTVY